MSTVKVCDRCDRRSEYPVLKIEENVRVRRLMAFWDHSWETVLEICEDCWSDLQKKKQK